MTGLALVGFMFLLMTLCAVGMSPPPGKVVRSSMLTIDEERALMGLPPLPARADDDWEPPPAYLPENPQPRGAYR